MKYKTHYCQDYREGNAGKCICTLCGNVWIIGKGWIEHTPSNREWAKKKTSDLYEK